MLAVRIAFRAGGYFLSHDFGRVAILRGAKVVDANVPLPPGLPIYVDTYVTLKVNLSIGIHMDSPKTCPRVYLCISSCHRIMEVEP